MSTSCLAVRAFPLTYCYDTVEDDAVVIPPLGQFSEVSARLAHDCQSGVLHGAMQGIPTYSRGVIPVQLQLDVSHAGLKHNGFHDVCEDVVVSVGRSATLGAPTDWED